MIDRAMIQSGPGMDHFFAYGSLQLPELMRAATGRDFDAHPARLPGYAAMG